MLLAALQFALGAISVPISWVPGASFASVIIFLALPVLAIYFGANYPWRLWQGLVFVLGGAAIWLLPPIFFRNAGSPFISLAAGSISQAGLMAFCLGVGAMLACAIRERNMLLPVSIFLALLDVMLVLTPMGPVGKIARGSQQILSDVAYKVPAVSNAPTRSHIAAVAFVGPADLLFMAMFFIVLFRFGMQTKRTLLVMIPTVILYMLVVLLFGSARLFGFTLAALPAMVPIGAAMLLSNLREFHLTRSEKASTAIVAAAGLLLVIWGAIQSRPEMAPPEKAPQSAPSTGAGGQASRISASSPSQAARG